MTLPGYASGRRGGPLVMLLLVLTVWTGARALWWENPFAVIGAALGQPIAAAPLIAAPTATLAFAPAGGVQPAFGLRVRPVAVFGLGNAGLPVEGLPARMDPQIAAARPFLLLAALRQPAVQALEQVEPAGLAWDFPLRDAVPFVPTAPRVGAGAGNGRWSFDSWAFWRQGSGAAPISQGRVPIYGASQVGAVLHYRLTPDTRRDLRLYARAYRALVRRGEQELAAGVSARPVGRVPVRVAAEARYTDAAFTNEVRPSVYAVTEFAPVGLPIGMQLDAYGQAGWVGGASATAFADGQVSVTHDVRAVAAASDAALRLSVGAGAWGGAQDDAQRFDIGPTLRLDLTVGEVPARLSLDWRERIGGQAGPDSGLAATLSTRF